MRNRRNTFMAGVAALALVTGAGLASAQEQPQDHTGARETKQPNAMQQMHQQPASGKMGPSARQEDRNTGAAHRPRQPTAQNKDNERNAQTNERRDNMNARTNEQRNDMKGLQGNASGVDVRLSDQQKTQIRTTVIEARGAPRVDHVNFDVTVGTAIPRGGVRIVPVPATLVQIEPAWRGFQYFVYEEEIVIVNPRDMKIVAVLVV
jgi:hypothetical protein